MKRLPPLLLCLACVLTAFPAARADAPTPPGFDKVQPLVEKYCVKCHSGAKPRGGLALDAFKDMASVQKKPRVWEKVSEYLRGGMMPPEGKPKPTSAELDVFYAWLDADVLKVDCTAGPKDPGRVTIRRLNRAEYNNTIRDLVGVNFHPADDFPSDDVGYGFDNIGDVLSMPPILMEKYLAAAEKVDRGRLEVRRAPQPHPHRPAQGQEREPRRRPQDPQNLRRTRLAPARQRRRDAPPPPLHRRGRPQRRRLRHGDSAGPAGGARVAALPLPRRDRQAGRRRAARRQRLGAGHAAVVFPLEQHARRRNCSASPARATCISRTCWRPRCGGC